jgi:heme/copper-type cytochrome/quinol oxidase subunit 2
MAQIFAYRRWIILGLLGLAVILIPAPASSKTPSQRTIRVEASNYQYTPSTIKVNPGDRVTLELVSTDVVHGIYIDGYDLEMTADPGQTQSLTFTAGREGTFRLRCSVTCGPLHPFMIAKLQVGRNWLYWRASLLALGGIVAFLWFARKPQLT